MSAEGRRASVAEWLSAQIAADEVRTTDPHDWYHGNARLRAQCEAYRKIVELHRPSTDHGDTYDAYCVGCWEEGGMDGAPTYPCRTIRIIAGVYGTRPGFREEWVA